MTTVSKQEILARWETLSDTLREALTSQESAEALQHILEAEHVPEQKRGRISGVIGLALLGFIHPEELRIEIESATGLPPQVATAIASAVVSRILEPLRQELNKAYAPVGSTPRATPQTLSDMRPAMPGMPTLIQSSPIKPPAPTGFGQSPRPITQPFASAMPAKPAAAPAAPAPQAAPAPAPVILHREAEFKPIQQGSSSLRGDILGKAPVGTGATSMFGNRPAAAAPRGPVAAKIEFSGSGMMKPQAPIVSRTEASIPRVVHYSEMKTPVSPFGTAEAGAVRAPQAPQYQAPIVKPAMPPSVPTAPPPRPVAPAAPPKPTPPVAPVGMMTDLKKILTESTSPSLPRQSAPQPPAPPPTVPKPPAP